ncbi:MAG: hypothetical protein KatS3mg010_1218 [Acidimicrobiia bacterium]|nr:MAG: hypothetical protein KatS3mg010_1218 [Acidimicrobiia bacterium]
MASPNVTTSASGRALGLARVVDDGQRRGHVPDDRRRVGAGCGERLLGGRAHRLPRLLAHRVDLLGREHAARDERVGEDLDRVVLGLVLQLVGGAVLLLVVGERVRVRPRHERVHEARPGAGAHPRDRVGPLAPHLEVVATVHLHDVQAADAAHHLRDRRGVLVRRPYRYRVPVVGDDVQHGEVQAARGVERLPELPLRRRPLAERHVGHLVAVRVAARQLRPAADVARGLRAADGGKALAPRARRLRHDVQLAVAPVARHLPAARGRVVTGADRLQEDVERRDAQREHERAVAVVGEEPVVSGPQRAREPEQQRLVARAGDLEEDLRLLAQHDLAVVEEPRHEREPEVVDGLLYLRGCGGLDRAGPIDAVRALDHAHPAPPPWQFAPARPRRPCRAPLPNLRPTLMVLDA